MHPDSSNTSSFRRLLWPIVAVTVAAAIWFAWRSDSTTPENSAAKPVDDVRTLDDERTPTNVTPSDAAPSRSEPVATSVIRAPSPSLTMFVQDALGVPVVRANYFVVDSVNEVQRGELDDRGSAALVASDGLGELLVMREAMLTQIIELDLSAGERVVRLPVSHVVSGVVTIGGAPPTEPMLAQLLSVWDPRVRADLPAEVFDSLSADWVMSCMTDSHGGFEFGGLAAEWHGTLQFPSRYTFANDSRSSVRLDRPARGLRFELAVLPHLVGRIVDVRGEPVPELNLNWILFESDDSGTGSSVVTDIRGHFEIPFSDPSRVRLQLRAESPISGRLDRLFELSTIGANLDLGDIELDPFTALQFRVVGPDSDPIAGARGRLEDRPETWSTTNELGLASVLGLPSDNAQLRVLAEGFHAVVIPVVLPSDDVIEVHMTLANRLTITVLDAELRVSRGIALKFASSGVAIFADNNRWDPSDTTIGVLAGESLSMTYTLGRRSEGWIKIRPDSNGRVILQGLNAGLRLQVAVLDSIQRIVLEREIAPLGEVEHRDVELVLPETLGVLGGFVHDENGVGLGGAQVVTADDATITTTDANGMFEIIGISAHAATIDVRRDGFAPARITDLRIESASHHVDIALKRGRKFDVKVIDENDAPVKYGRVRARSPRDGLAFHVVKRRVGQHQVTDAPMDEVELELELAGNLYKQRNFPTDSNATFRVPVHGRLAVTLEPTEGVGEFWHHMRLSSGDPNVATLELTAPPVQRLTMEFDPVLPGEYSLTFERWIVNQASEQVGDALTVRIEPGAKTDIKWPR